MSDVRFQHDAFFIDQLIRPVANLYRISTLGPDRRSAGEPLAFVRQKKLAIKEDIRFFADESENVELFRLKARAMLEFAAKYDVTTPAGERVGTLQKVFGASLVRSRWRILGPDEQEIAQAYERSLPIALLRRAKELVPYAEFVPVPFHFDVLRDGTSLGSVDRAFSVRDRYTLDLSGDPERSIDRRVAIALAIGLDALQNR